MRCSILRSCRRGRLSRQALIETNMTSIIPSVLRSIGAILLSLVVAVALLIAVEGFSAIFHPFPPGVDPTDMEVCKAHVARYPGWVLAAAGVGWGGVAFATAWIATRLGAGRHRAHGIAIGSLLALAAAFNMVLLPYPIWFEVAMYVILPIAVFSATRLASAPSAEARKGIV